MGVCIINSYTFIQNLKLKACEINRKHLSVPKHCTNPVHKVPQEREEFYMGAPVDFTQMGIK